MLILLVGAAAVAATALLVSAPFAEGSVTQWLLGAYVAALSEIVLISLLLSIRPHLTRWVLFATVCIILVVVAAAVRRPELPPVRAASRLAMAQLRDPPIALLGVAVVGVIGYSIALGVFRPPNDGDAIEYHLARGAFWKQQHAIGYIHGAADGRIDAFPANGEIAMAFTMILSGTGRFAPLVQLVAALATSLAVYGIGRRIGIGVRESLFAALLFLTLPVFALQASTGLNDVVVASFVAAAVFFFLRQSGTNLVFGGVSVALLIGTKLTAFLTLPLIAAVALVAARRRRLIAVNVVAVASVLGAYWYVLNLVKADRVFGAVSGERGHTGGVLETIARTLRLATDAFELTGAIGLDRLFYVLAAIAVTAVAMAARRPLRERATWAAVAAGTTLAPLVLVALDHGFIRAISKLFSEIDRPQFAWTARTATKASPIFSWCGPLGVLLTVAVAGFVVRAVRRRELPVVAIVLVAAPAVAVVLLGIALPYYEWNGRYIAGSFALAVGTWGTALAVRPIAWGAAALATITTLLMFVHLHDRQSGIRLIEPTHDRSVWSLPSWSVEATDHPDLRELFRYVTLDVPGRVRLALEPNVYPGGVHTGGNLPPFPFFGSHLTRTILYADSPRQAADREADWAILRDDGFGRCVAGWEETFRYDVWVVLRRASGSRCA